VGLGRVLHALAGSRRRIALRNLELCLPELPLAERQAIVKKHFEWLGRSLLERGVLWHASYERLKRLIRVEGDIGWGDRHPDRALMWLVPHFIGMDVAGVASQLLQAAAWPPSTRRRATRSSTTPSAAAATASARATPSRATTAPCRWCAPSSAAASSSTCPTWTSGCATPAFVPFFGVSASTLLAPSRMARSMKMTVQPVVTEILPGGQGYVVRFGEPWDHWPTDDALADAAHERVDRSRDPPQPQPVPVGAQALQDPAGEGEGSLYD
jgi:KDO2-lipid IV(A) lauroyltransferase